MRFNQNLVAVGAPPIADVQNWVAGVEYPADRPLLDVAQAVPSYRPAAELEQFIGDISDRPEVSRYTPILGIPALREALAAHFSEDYEADIPTGSVALTAGCNQAFCLAVAAIAGPGDEVILPLPYYFNHHMWLQMQGIRPVMMPMAETGPAAPEPETLAALVTDRTRAIVLVNPSNPTGLELDASTMAAIFELAAHRDLALIVDETYKDFRSRPGPNHGLFSDPRWPETLIHLWSFSKSYSLTGYRLGSITTGSAAMAQIEKVMDCVAICAARISQEAGLYALRHLRAWCEAKTLLMAERRDQLKASFRQSNTHYELLSCGAFFAYLRHPYTGASSTDVARWLAREHGIMCVPGEMFGPAQGPYLRLAFANLETERVPELVQRLEASQLDRQVPFAVAS